MFTNLKAKNYKGISEIKLDGLGNINIICGKNNSGKTSILEALSSAKGFAIGRKVNSTEWLEELFAPEADRYTNPDPGVSKRWFKNYIAGLIQSQAVWYSDEYETIINDVYISIKKEPSLNHYNNNLFNIDKVLDKYFDISKYKPILIPAKRILNYEDIIDLQSINTPNGHKIINRLFLLKNQIENSIEFKKYNKIYSAFEVITGYSFNIKAENKNNIKIYFKKDPYEWLEGDACGLGLSDILILVTFSIDSDCSMIFIEEPENHLHPEMQKKFLNFIRGIKSKQFILSTHSNIFLNPNIVDKIFYVSFLNNVTISDETSKSEILYNLGYSVADNLVADLVVLTEGPSDIPVLSTIFEWMGIGDKYNIRFWPLGGDIMAYLDLAVFAEKSNVFALIDSDPGSHVARTRFERNCKMHGIRCHRLERYSLESYFTLEAIKKSVADIPETVIELDNNKSIDEQLGTVDRSIKSKNGKIIKLMTMDDIKDSDLYSFCLKIKQFLEGTNHMSDSGS